MIRRFFTRHFDSILIASFIMLAVLGVASFVLNSDPHNSETTTYLVTSPQRDNTDGTQFCIAVIFPLVIALGIWLSGKQRAFTPNTTYATQLDPREAEQNPRVAPPIFEPAKAHALEAMHAAGLDPEHTPLNAVLIDIGMIAFWGDTAAYAHRTTPIPVTAVSLQPYAQLELRQEGIWNIEFEIVDSGETTVFQRTVQRELKLPQRLLMTPPARLALAELAHDGEWTLRLRANSTLIAAHRFTWQIDNIEGLEGNIESDGEINESILILLADNYAQPLSLDDLLASNNETKQQGE